MHDLQKLIYGGYAAANEYSAKQLLTMAPCDLQSSKRVRIAWMLSPVVQAFIRNACEIALFDKMVDAYQQHLEDMPTFETFSRSARAESGDSLPTAAQKQASAPPSWYALYLRSSHWKNTSRMAHGYYNGCVLCASYDDLECHHRHYNSLGKEKVTDLSILCNNHHSAVHPLLGIKVPRSCPANVIKILEDERLLHTLSQEATHDSRHR